MNIQSLLENLKKEEQRNEDFLHLTANEGRMSQTALNFLSSHLSERYFMGAGSNGQINAGGFTALGLPAVAELVTTAEEAAKKMLGAELVSLNFLSGVHAMMCAILAGTEPGDTVMTVHHDHGGHFATRGLVERTGRKHVWAPYKLESLEFDVDQIGKVCKEKEVKAIYFDVSYYINPYDISSVRKAVGNDVVIIFDASHTMGLIMGQTFQSPLKEGADIMCANTHKTLPGPQKGMMAFRDARFGAEVNSVIESCMFSSPHTHHLIALAITILEMEKFGKSYAEQVVKNSNAIGSAFEQLGYEVRRNKNGKFSANHQAHIFTDKKGDIRDLYSKLYANNITVNFDNPLGDRFFIRLGTQEVTRRGMKEQEMSKIANFIKRAFNGEQIREEVIAFNREFDKIYYSFDTV